MDEKKDLVTITHPDYDASCKDREIFADVCAGTATLREKGKAYLPQFPAELDEDWKYRKDTATLLNVTKKAVDTFCGLVFQKDISLGDDVPDEIKGTEETSGLVENIDNRGTHLNVFARDLFESSFDGWAAILVEAPTTKVTDLGQQRSLGLRPYCIAYDACDITNWAYEINPLSKRKELAMVVLRERLTEKAGQFLRKNKIQYRVLMLDDARRPIWQVWTEKETKDASGQHEYELLTANQGTFEKQTRIPFAVVGELGDKPPLMDLTFKNLEHYQTYSDYKSIIHKTCVPMLWTAGLDGDAPENIGGSTWWKLTEQGKMGFAEVAGGSIEKTRQCLEDIKGDMSMLGLQMLMANRRANADVTATEKLLDSIQETSSLQVQATQLKDAIELAFEFMAAYLGKGEDKGGSIELGATWSQLTLTAQELTAWSNLVDLGQMSLETFIQLRQEAGQLPDDVDARKELERIKAEMKEAASVVPVINAKKQPNEVNNATAPDQNGKAAAPTALAA